VRGMRSCR